MAHAYYNAYCCYAAIADTESDYLPVVSDRLFTRNRRFAITYQIRECRIDQ